MTVAILALVSGAAVISGLLNLDLGVEYQLTQQFRTLGANIVIAATSADSASASAPASAALMNQDAVLVPLQNIADANVSFAPFIYVVARAESTQVVVVGTWLDELHNLNPTWKLQGNWIASRDSQTACLVGANAAKHFHLGVGSQLRLQYLARTSECLVSGIVDSGAADDNQIFMNLNVVQILANLQGKISVIQLDVSGNPKLVSSVASRLSEALPQFQVRPIREVTDAEGALLGHIRLLIVSMIILILILTALCVLATMAALAIERRADVGLMKALGGSISRIVGFFLAEVGILGAFGGLVGAVLGVALSYWMGLRVFGAAILPRWEVFPVTILLMTIVAMAGALPLRLLGEVKPAIILRGE